MQAPKLELAKTNQTYVTIGHLTFKWQWKLFARGKSHDMTCIDSDRQQISVSGRFGTDATAASSRLRLNTFQNLNSSVIWQMNYDNLPWHFSNEIVQYELISKANLHNANLYSVCCYKCKC